MPSVSGAALAFNKPGKFDRFFAGSGVSVAGDVVLDSRRTPAMQSITARYCLQRQQLIPRLRDEVFAFFANAGNLETITPPWLGFCILTPQPIQMRAGVEIDYRISWRFLRIRWRTEIVEWRPVECFVDVQTKGPYRFWRHTHSFEAVDGGTLMRDSVEYELPFGLLGRMAHWLRVRRDLQRIFDYRAAEIAARFGEVTGPSRG